MARIDDFKESFRLASLELNRKDPVMLARTAGVELSSRADGRELIVNYLGGNYLVEISSKTDIRRQDSAEEVPLPDKILIAHYLLGASGKRPHGKLITFRQVPDGQFYFDAFQKRARDPFVSFFGANGRLFRKCAETMGAKPVENGDFGMEFRVFPQICVQLVLWQGDDEFPPESSVLFEDNIQYDLEVEDVAVLSGMLVYRLMGIARSLQAGG